MIKPKGTKQKTENVQLESVLNEIDRRIISKKVRKKILREMSRVIGDICKGNKNVYSVFTAGSLTRGDFIPGTSDFDLVVIFKEEKDESEFLKILEEKSKKEFQRYFGDTSHADWGYDTRSEFLSRIPTVANPNPKNRTNIGYFGFRAFDTVRCGKVLYGNNFLKDLIAENPKELAKTRVGDLLKKYQSNNDDMWKIMHIGDIIKATQIYFSKATYNKREVLKGFVQFVPDFEAKNFIFEFWGEYLDNQFFEKNDKKEFMKKAELFLSQLVKTMDKQNPETIVKTPVYVKI